MLRYDRQTRPGLVTLYDIRPGNGAGPFLQPRSPHGAIRGGGITNKPIDRIYYNTLHCVQCKYAKLLLIPYMAYSFYEREKNKPGHGGGHTDSVSQWLI